MCTKFRKRLCPAHNRRCDVCGVIPLGRKLWGLDGSAPAKCTLVLGTCQFWEGGPNAGLGAQPPARQALGGGGVLCTACAYSQLCTAIFCDVWPFFGNTVVVISAAIMVDHMIVYKK